MQKRSYGSGSIGIRNGVYYGRWRVGGRQLQSKLGRVRQPGSRDGLTQKMAEERLREVMAESSALAVNERLTVSEAGIRLLSYLETMGRKPSTLRGYRHKLQDHIIPALGTKALVDVRRGDVEALVVACVKRGLSPKMTGHVLALLHRLYSYAIGRGWATLNPCHGVEAPRVLRASSEIRFLTIEEVGRVLDAIPGDEFGCVYRPLVLAAATTGLRKGELVGLRWRDIDWAAQRIRVESNIVAGVRGTPKSGRSRAVPLADQLGAELRQLKDRSGFPGDDDPVFANPATGCPLHPEAVSKAYKRARMAAGVRPVRFHDLRHTFGTQMAAAGVPMRTLMELMGHSDLSTTLIYAAYAPSAQEVEMVNRVFGGLAA